MTGGLIHIQVAGQFFLTKSILQPAASFIFVPALNLDIRKLQCGEGVDKR